MTSFYYFTCLPRRKHIMRPRTDFFRISERQPKQPDHQRHGQDGKQRAQDIDCAGMRGIPVIELCHGGDRCTGGCDSRKVDRHQDGLAVWDPVGCTNCPKQQDNDQRNTQQTQEHRQIVARGAENLFSGTSAMAIRLTLVRSLRHSSRATTCRQALAWVQSNTSCTMTKEQE